MCEPPDSGARTASLPPSEEFLVRLWRHHAQRSWLYLDGGSAVRVVYPGARHRARGPDFQGALLLGADGQLRRGDVEVHVWPAEWEAHRHHVDPAYDHVILHVVWESALPARARRSNGSLVPQLAFSACLPEAFERLLEEYARQQTVRPEPPAWSPSAAGGLLETAGLARFYGRAAECEADVEALGPGQALYRRVAQALGYTANQRPFLRLADQVPLQEVLVRLQSTGVEATARHMLAWAGLTTELVAEGLRREDWLLAGLRPANHPNRRVLALCQLIARSGADLAQTLADAVYRAAKLGRPAGLLAAIAVPAVLPVTVSSLRPVAASLLGPSRATEVAINAVLPWAHAWGDLADRLDLRDAALHCYRTFPRGAENAITREAARLLGFPSRAARTACQQQGLLHLYRTELNDMESWQQAGDGTWRWRPRVEPAPARQPTPREGLAAG